MSQKMVTEEQFQEWKAHPVTQAQAKMLEVWRELLRDRLEDGSALDARSSGLLLHARIVGALDVVKQLQDFDHAGLVSALGE